MRRLIHRFQAGFPKSPEKWRRKCFTAPRPFVVRVGSSSSSSTTARASSTVHRGIAFEERSIDILQQVSMSVKRVGGKDDGGIDLLGWWWLPDASPQLQRQTTASGSSLQRRRIRVICQCKAEKKKIGPNYVRELEGVLYRLMMQRPTTDHVLLNVDTEVHPQEEMLSVEDPSLPMVALLVSQSMFTKSAILRANSSSIPFCLLHLPPIDSIAQDSLSERPPGEFLGNLGTVWCNYALCGTQGLLKGRMEVRWERRSENDTGRPALWWDGHRLPSWIPDSKLDDVDSPISSNAERELV